MVCTANDLLEWKDFPKGLRILLLDEDRNSASEIKSTLEEMEFIVIAFSSEHEALSAISSKNEIFHVAIIKVNHDGRCDFLECAKDLPTIMISKEHCLNTMMKCIALGAVEFLVEPISEDKLRNIWQHVVHKAFNTSGSRESESLKSVKEFVGSILEMQQQNVAVQTHVSEESMIDTVEDEGHHDQSAAGDKFPAPSTPQIKHAGRSLDDGDYHDQTNNSPVKEGIEFDGEIKSVDNTNNGNSFAEMEVDPPQPTCVGATEEEVDCRDGSKGTDGIPKPCGNNEESNKKSSKNACGVKNSRKRMKIDWTPDLHKKFVQAVEQLGVDQAIPSRILELMKVEGLTRHNIASHLQKYRMHRRHILPKQDERRWPQPRHSIPRNYYPHHRPVMAYPPYQTNHAFISEQVYPVWSQQAGYQLPGFPMWGSPSYPWKPYPPMHADAWGCPVMPPPPCPTSPFPHVQCAYGFHSPDTYRKNSADMNPGEEVIDKVVKEAISKPWLPLPIGLKPPSIDSVLAELSRQGISTIPPPNGHHPC
ncbi:two-component response regulator-like APRR2 isoform X2 [Amaranthus tricolor]|uniref:two-component response regulator-like APRR2 isoform X2 n=1 Tax=Amaranthus tricolor TaxID=29722 RepID=UPI0025857FD8|nr:two-component response regulator-like APRR2 isoform X2 [Amaranthus tricolor]XP_057520319.1 two-component response regulator-like APRR2 isoform X2 [Amaranthus tricolor]